MDNQHALFIVDLQNDFLPGGKLEVSEGDMIISSVNSYIEMFSNLGLPIFASRDLHPKKTIHFKQYGGQWPEHCVIGTSGADFPDTLHVSSHIKIITKGMNPQKDSYSAFDGTFASGESLNTVLNNSGIRELFVCGLATDYCVKWTVLEALLNGFLVTVLKDAIKGVNVGKNDSKEALKEMKSRGANVAGYYDIQKELSENRILF